MNNIDNVMRHIKHIYGNNVNVCSIQQLSDMLYNVTLYFNGDGPRYIENNVIIVIGDINHVQTIH